MGNCFSGESVEVKNDNEVTDTQSTPQDGTQAILNAESHNNTHFFVEHDENLDNGSECWTLDNQDNQADNSTDSLKAQDDHYEEVSSSSGSFPNSPRNIRREDANVESGNFTPQTGNLELRQYNQNAPHVPLTSGKRAQSSDEDNDNNIRWNDLEGSLSSQSLPNKSYK